MSVKKIVFCTVLSKEEKSFHAYICCSTLLAQLVFERNLRKRKENIDSFKICETKEIEDIFADAAFLYFRFPHCLQCCFCSCAGCSWLLCC